MQKAAGRILRSEQVTLEGSLQLDMRHVQPNLSKGMSAPSVTSRVRMVENKPEFAVIEIICSCGRRTYLRCEYTDNESPAEAAEVQTAVSEAPARAANQTK